MAEVIKRRGRAGRRENGNLSGFLFTAPYALLFLVFTVILQTIDGYIIKPKLFGGTLGVPSSGILITIVVGGNLFGIVGILLAIPIAAILTFIYKEYFFPWLLRRKERMGTIERRGK